MSVVLRSPQNLKRFQRLIHVVPAHARIDEATKCCLVGQYSESGHEVVDHAERLVRSPFCGKYPQQAVAGFEKGHLQARGERRRGEEMRRDGAEDTRSTVHDLKPTIT